ncbi:hypothetical protein [Candidatus Mycoplasma haematominutum]|uniref:Uncharacterized protein n=1 Tax=Candidatus Mycoplasma haematominutum 'Birmingham 1' TaxID=1116213 RepID=G8C374_9MOLU|nr:hypothetical protein [Candidatus Mycoplasma haematominutum]CCE66772.1 hypothetical protein MHM_02540 [Candidatus Mycoplasma haematominutum 'Birmingham 1']
MSLFFKLVALSALGGTIGGSVILQHMETPPPEDSSGGKKSDS